MQVSVHKPGEHDLLLAGFLDGRDEVLVVPRIHRGTLDGLLTRKDRLELRPHVAAEGLGFDGGQHNRHVEDPRRLCQGDRAVDDRLTIEIRGSEEHLRLVIDERDDAIVGREQSFFAALYATVVLRHRYRFPFLLSSASGWGKFIWAKVAVMTVNSLIGFERLSESSPFKHFAMKPLNVIGIIGWSASQKWEFGWVHSVRTYRVGPDTKYRISFCPILWKVRGRNSTYLLKGPGRLYSFYFIRFDFAVNDAR